MTPDTWGISGPTFLIVYLGAIIVVAVAATVHRRALFAGRPSGSAWLGTGVERLGPQQVAYLNGRERLALYTALGGLRAAEAIGPGPDRTLVQTGPLLAGATPLDTAVYNAAGKHVRARDLGSDEWVRAAMTQLRDGLEAAGLATTAAQRRTARLWTIAGAALVALGIARLAAGLASGHPVGFLIGSIMLAAAVAIVLPARASAVPTRAATADVARLRRQHEYLSPRQSPAYATYGPGGAAMGVALFGAASLYAMDPAFAAEAGIRQASALGATGAWAGGGTSCGGGGGGGCGG